MHPTLSLDEMLFDYLSRDKPNMRGSDKQKQDYSFFAIDSNFAPDCLRQDAHPSRRQIHPLACHHRTNRADLYQPIRLFSCDIETNHACLH